MRNSSSSGPPSSRKAAWLAGVRVTRRRHPGRPAAEVWQRWWAVGALGFGSLWVAVAFLVAPSGMADAIGFAHSPFQFEIACANVGFALLGFRAASASASARERLTCGLAAAFLWGAAAGHLHQWFAHGDHADGNTGGILANDLLIPTVVIALAARDLRRAGRAGRTGRTATGPARTARPVHRAARLRTHD
ncbi:hypothetical protein K353_05802 [Kitasatospora sp. SolWspMP-SS2h]|uniref:DUF6790 family protein n=1 Tax=Kitasatospora sp. SolWspMP-SS2h TaxID=1305729 RepID=UPI000DBFAFF0|nr:DUF6790 family protein [Kitasatospora sp. SolWspMP-SS2h]RAJ33158.1 hypothetical protein K353_05802 [Kitasatospora sp. SolWspMP-SS2h]